MSVSAPDPDRLFVQYCESGEPERLADVYDAVAPELMRVALHLVGDPADAEDLLQATLLVAIERARDFDTERRVLPWLVGILARKARERRGAARRRPDPERLQAMHPETSDGPDARAVQEELRDCLGEALARVPEPYRPVVHLRLRRGLSVPEISATLMRPPGTVRSQMARGLELLRRILPVGLAGASVLAIARPARGLAAVRRAFLENVPATAPAMACVSPLVVGSLMMKKVVLATGGLAVLVAGLWNAGGGGGSEEAGARPMHRPQRAKLEALGGGHAAEAGATRAPEREAIPPPTAEPTPDPKPEPVLDLAALTVVVWSDGERVADEVVVLRHYGAGNFWPERIQRTG
ncbi:MAG: sigma-70 family RNA polymerase sigma factor, partial [bacterium]|nr:sigma-70 family RNA polymerase sigma factor [bacterium]